MYPERPSKPRPSIQQRFEKFRLSHEELNVMIRLQEDVYRTTRNESALQVLNMLKAAKVRAMAADYWPEEDTIRDQELRELLQHANEYPFSVVIWAASLRDDEMQ